MALPVTNTTTDPALSDSVGGVDAPEAVGLGRSINTGRKIRYAGDQHILVFGPNGKGKGTRVLMPNLLQMSGSSLVVVDPKGELAAVTAEYRRTLGRVVIINPFGVLTDRPRYEDLRSHGFNPLVRLDPAAKSFNAEASLLADAMIASESKDPHWSQSARALVAALIMFVVIEKREPSLGAGFGAGFRNPAPGNPNAVALQSADRTRASAPLGTIARVRELLTLASNEGEGNAGPIGLPKLADTIMKMNHANITGMRNKASQFTNWNREIQSIASTAKIQTEPFDDPEIAEDLAKDGFDFRDLKKEPVTVYLILPPDMMARQSKWLRLLLTSAIQSVMRAREPGEPKVMFMMDEFFALGHLEIISTVWALVRGYGIQMMPILQDLNQLKKLYPDMWETFVGMAGAVMSFAPNDMTTAEWLSKRVGDTSRLSISYNSGSSSGGSGPGSHSEGFNYSTVKAPLLSPHQLFGLHKSNVIVSLDGVSNVVGVETPAYYEIVQTDLRARKNPYYHG
jgi:type IV secretion system protein VirD4